MNKMTECLLNYNDIILDDIDIINDNNEKYIPKLFKPITEDNIYLVDKYSPYKNLYKNNNLHVRIYRLLDKRDYYEIEVLLLYKNMYQLYISYRYDKIYEKRGIKEAAHFKIGSMKVFKMNNKCVEYIDSFKVMYIYYVEETLRNILDDINKLGVNMTYYKFVSILKEIPIINEIYDKYEIIYQSLPEEVKNRDLFTIIADYI
jgi:hypothetical protein